MPALFHLSSPDVWNPDRDATRTMMKERFMYGEPTQKKEAGSTSKMDQAINAWIKKKWQKLKGKAEGGRVDYAGGSPLSSGELDDLLVRLRDVVEGSGMYSNFSQQNRKSLQIALTSRINVLLGNQ